MSALPESRREHARETQIERIAYSPSEAAQALGCSVDFLTQHVADELRWTRRGRRRFVAVKELERWLQESASRVLEGR